MGHFSKKKRKKDAYQYKYSLYTDLYMEIHRARKAAVILKQRPRGGGGGGGGVSI